jgi:hypothetical protein
MVAAGVDGCEVHIHEDVGVLHARAKWPLGLNGARLRMGTGTGMAVLQRWGTFPEGAVGGHF